MNTHPIADSSHFCTVITLAWISLTSAEIWTKIFSAAIPAIVCVAYTVWKWRKESKKKD